MSFIIDISFIVKVTFIINYETFQVTSMDLNFSV